MKKFYKFVSISLFIFMMTSFNPPIVFAKQSKKTMTILFTHDMHDHVEPFDIKQNGETIKLGGYARLQSAIKEERKKDPNLVLVDGGDYSMGSLFQTIYTSDSPELRMLGQMDYDAVTFGNHEFDFRAKGLADNLNIAKNSGDKVPKIVASNINFSKNKNGKLTKSLTELKKAMKDYGVKDYTIIKRNGIKIGVFGLMGKDGAACAPMAEVEFTDAIKNAKRVVKTLKEKEKVDITICLSHSGLSDKKSDSEDEILAKKVPDIDVIISGHSHTKIDKPIIVGKTIIGCCGEYCENLGIIKVFQGSNKEWNLENYNIKPIDKSLPDDVHMSKVVEKFKKIVQNKYLDVFDMKFDEVLAYSPFNFIPTSNIGKKHKEDTLGNFISDAYMYSVKKAEGEKYEPVAVAMVPSGTMRDSFVKGNITVANAFNVSSLGVGADKIAGYPLISVYLTGKELKTVCEVDASITPIMSAAQLYMSGISYTFNPNRMIFNKVTEAKLQKSDGTFEKIDDDKLYRTVAGLYSAQMLSVVGKKSHGLLSIIPKNKEGKPLTNYESQIIRNTTDGKNIEVKEWIAIADYLKSFDKVDGVSQVPQYYNKTQDRKVVDDNKNILALLSHPNKIAIAVYAIIICVIIIISLIISKIVKRKKYKKIINHANNKHFLF